MEKASYFSLEGRIISMTVHSRLTVVGQLSDRSCSCGRIQTTLQYGTAAAYLLFRLPGRAQEMDDGGSAIPLSRDWQRRLKDGEKPRTRLFCRG
jgi:hypothetical protein